MTTHFSRPISADHPGSSTTADYLRLDDQYVAHTYAPLPVVATSAEGAWITDVTGRRHLDLLSAYSAMNFGHTNPRILAAATEQLHELTLVSRAFHQDRLGAFAESLCRLVGKDMMVPMNTGAEAVETAIKVSRKWAYEVKGVPADQATIIVASNNFHGRTTTIISFSDDADARAGYGPFTPGFVVVPFGDADALAAAITDHTAAVLLEPIQGEAGVIIPPPDYLPRVRSLCTERNVLFIADEVQSGLARTGRTLACGHTGVEPDLIILGKALGGGIVPVSAVLGDRAVLGIFRPGQHGSTFGGNALACAVGSAVVEILEEGTFQERATRVGAAMTAGLETLLDRGVREVRTIGLWAGIDIDPDLATGRQVCERLAQRGVLAKDTHGSTIRWSPPLVIEAAEVEFAVEQLAAVLDELR
jgi:ornithine--oxo-acid transaminase